MTAIADRSAVELRDAIARGDVTARAAVEASFDQMRDVGAGRDAKVKVDFDDEAIGRKTLVIAQANLERGDD